MASPIIFQVISTNTTELPPGEETRFIYETIKNKILELVDKTEVWEVSGYGWGEDWSGDHQKVRVFLARLRGSRKIQYGGEIITAVEQNALKRKGTEIVKIDFFVCHGEKELHNLNRLNRLRRIFGRRQEQDDDKVFYTSLIVKMFLENANDKAFLHLFIKGKKLDVDYDFDSDGACDFSE
jgi:hypothetical protein